MRILTYTAAILPLIGAYSAMVGGVERKRAIGRWGLPEGRTGASPRNPQSLDNQIQFDFKPIQIEKFRKTNFSIISLNNTHLFALLFSALLSRSIVIFNWCINFEVRFFTIFPDTTKTRSRPYSAIEHSLDIFFDTAISTQSEYFGDVISVIPHFYKGRRMYLSRYVCSTSEDC